MPAPRGSARARGRITGSVVCALLCAGGCRSPKQSPPTDETTGGSSTSTAAPGEVGEVSTSTETGTRDETTTGGPLGPLRLRFEAIEVPAEFSLVTDIRFVPGSSELLVLSKDGRVGHYALEEGRAERIGGFTVPGVHSDLDCGLISIAFDPEFELNHFVFMSACASQPDNVIVRLELDTSNYAAIPDSMVEIFRASEPDAPRPWHNIGAIGFDDTGALWALLGDKRVAANGQDLSNDLSALVRIVPDRSRGGSGYAPAPDNPFVDDPERSPNVYAWGLRSPWRGLYDSKGRWWFGDVGTNGFEEIDIVTGPGLNFGWALHEGPCEQACDDTVQPVGGYPHDTDTAYIQDDEDARATIRRAIWLGLEYDPGGGPDPYDGRLTGAVLYGDFCVGFVRALEVDDAGAVTRDDHLGHLPFAAGWDRAPDGHLYVASFGRCESVNIDEGDPPPSRLFRAVPAD